MFVVLQTMILLAVAAGPRSSADQPVDPARVRPNAHVETCTNSGCHAEILRHPFTHGPTSQGACRACHAELEPREHTFRDALPRQKMCLTCHPISMRDVVHQPVKDGDCVACHDPHGSPFKMMLKLDPATQLCQSCHADVGFARRKFVHGPVAAGACIICHEPHSSWHQKLLVKPARDVCISCHADVEKAAAGMRHPHPPVRDGLCTGCHDPHASDHPRQLRMASAELCVSCHAEVKEKIDHSAVVHGAVSAGDGCVACHVAHGSDIVNFQRSTQPAQCLSCHDKPLTDSAGRPLTDMAALLRDNPDHHGPIREGHCTGCHDPHASSRFRLLVADYPPEFYAPFNIEQYRLCFMCHRTELVISRGGRGVTNFRDDDRNLHAVHVNQEKGRTCRACHEVHASRNPFHMRDAVPFGAEGWMLEINYKKSDVGGSCAPGCHKPQAYDRRDFDLVPSTQPTGVSP